MMTGEEWTGKNVEKEAILSEPKMLPLHFSSGTDENHQIFSQVFRCRTEILTQDHKYTKQK
jgi:hypothetical protein